MRVWSDVIDREGMLYAALHDSGTEVWTGVVLDIRASVIGGARRRRNRFDCYLTGHGERHTRHVNQGTSANLYTDQYAATWMDWGWFIASIFRYDPQAVCGTYDGVADFLTQTTREYERRWRLKDRSVRSWADYTPSRRALGYSPFTEDNLPPPKRLVALHRPQVVEAWLSSE